MCLSSADYESVLVMSEVLMRSQRNAHKTMYEDGKNVAFETR
jgi:hypothetical protein